MPAADTITVEGRGLVAVVGRPLGWDRARVGSGMILPKAADVGNTPTTFPNFATSMYRQITALSSLVLTGETMLPNGQD